MIIQNPELIHFSRLEHPVVKGDYSKGFYDNGHCPCCGSNNVRTAKLDGDGSPYICKECWTSLNFMQEQGDLSWPSNISRPFNSRAVSLEDCKRAVSYIDNELRRRNIKKQKVAVMLQLYLSQVL